MQMARSDDLGSRAPCCLRLVDRVDPYRVNDRKEIKLAVLGLEVERLAWIALH